MAITDNMVINQTLTIKNLAKVSKELLFMLFLLALVLVLKPVKANAATLDVVAGSSAISADGSCQLEEALQNINNGARTHADCVETGAYGTDDTINLPAGTITGPGSGLQSIYGPSLKVIGEGRDKSIIENGRFYLSGSGLATSAALFKDFKMVGGDAGIAISGYNNAEVNNVEIDLASEGTNAISTGNTNLSIKDSYLHNGFDILDGSGYPAQLVNFTSDNDVSQSNLTVDGVTFSQAGTGLHLDAGSGLFNAVVKNSTFSNLKGDGNFENASAQGILVTTDGVATGNYSTINNTFSNIANIIPGSIASAAIKEYPRSDGTINHTAQNDIYAVGDGSSAVNYAQYDGSNLGTFNTTSNGGNLSSDNSFGSELDHATDQNNVTTLASFLGVLGDNGGKVPTLALLEDSPAIDAGTDASSAGVTTDARGISRPQGTSYDSGAYELEQSTPDPDPQTPDNGDPETPKNIASLTSPSSSTPQFSNRPITITTPTGTELTQSKTVTSDSLGTNDQGYKYPLGLVDFTFNTTQTDNQVTLTFITDLKPNQVKPRKYNPDTKAYTDIKDYTLTETTKDGKPALVLTYTITDNGDLDTNKTTGVIADPVGLAVTDDLYGKLANTGQNMLLATLAGTTITLTAIATLYINKLRAKSPKVKHYFSI